MKNYWIQNFGIPYIAIVIIIRLARSHQILRRLTISDYPGVDPAEFSKWRQLAIQANDAFLWTCCALLLIGIVMLIYVSLGNIDIHGILLIVCMFVGFIGGAVGTVKKSKADKLGFTAGIKRPHERC